MSFVVAIDGPAGTGKGTITNLISKEMNLVSIDTGATYRCVALYALKNNLNPDDTKTIIESLNDININMINDRGTQKVFLNGEDVSKEIRGKDIPLVASKISSIKEVREKLVEIQRNLAKGKDVIMEGRDITTVVFPNADVKIYMDADEKERAKRRYEEMRDKGVDTTFEEVLTSIRLRDKSDKEKEVGALKIAEDAIYLDTTNLSIVEVKEEVKKIIENKKGRK